MNSRTHSDIMTLALKDTTIDHPYAYARVLAVLHFNVQHLFYGQMSTVQTVPVLWVRHFRIDSAWKGGFKWKHLHCIEFLPNTDPNAFGFVSPDKVIREAHLIPTYTHGRTPTMYFESLACKSGKDSDWKYHYVNFFVDRNMLMRYLGGGVGHSYYVSVPDDEWEEEVWEVPDQDQPESTDMPLDNGEEGELEEGEEEDLVDGNGDLQEDEGHKSELSELTELSDSDDDDNEDKLGNIDLRLEDGEDGFDDHLQYFASGSIE
ncbi:hypothetical protein MIND_00543800 [Mycena indigotica]|uniref:Uncharacterized protein n=1 Tax=Mycena indigotica TaxID=2126181 RepID=A0A8H6SY89_9AGAR|nr:uncharacterized protein MIND_00543800 [Mycena indigotica]KAF7307493.1 hypothetical protein MIND_00543800 [Mycena indigotica]